jgi:hypothetical protein
MCRVISECDVMKLLVVYRPRQKLRYSPGTSTRRLEIRLGTQDSGQGRQAVAEGSSEKGDPQTDPRKGSARSRGFDLGPCA